MRKFTRILHALLKHGYTFLPIEEYLHRVPQGRSATITFDDGYTDQFNAARKILDPLNIKACFFISTSQIGQSWKSSGGINISGMTEKQIRTLSENGHYIGSHGHLHRNFSCPGEFIQDLKKSIQVIEDITGKKPCYYSAPFGVIGIESRQDLHRMMRISFLLGRTGVFQCWRNPASLRNRIPVNGKDDYFRLIIKHFLMA